MPQKNKLGDVLISWNLIAQKDLDEALKEQKEKGGFLGQILINKGLVSSTDIERALKQLSVKAQEKTELSQMLLDDRLITPPQLEAAILKQKETKQALEDVLVSLGLVSSSQVAETFSRHLGIPLADLSVSDIKPEILQLLPENIIRDYHIIPARLEKDTLFVAMADPLNLIALDEIKLISKYQVRPLIATKKDIQAIIDRFFNLQQMTKHLLADVRLEKISDEASVSRLVDNIIQAGINAHASDIHLEPQYPEMRVRLRIDGILHDVITVPKSIEPSLISRVKVMADMDITERRRPQDGHISLKINQREYDLRVASTSTITGEKIVIRILDKSGMLFSLNELGMTGNELEIFNSLVKRPYGIILVTGPTGSGKTTTLYAVLSQLDTLSNNIITIEDPVEYKLSGINQVQVNPVANITFATGLRSMLRQDPDIIMVGEIRDLETATIAIHAALTGHLVLSTLHTNDAPSAITRLLDMGVEPFLISSALIGVVAQRLVRRICSECKEEYSPQEEVLKDLGLEHHKDKMAFYRGRGCQHCLQTAYRGRMGVFEIMKVSDKIRDLITRKEPVKNIKEVAITEGMVTLRKAALDKVINGFTTPEEIKRVIFTAE